MALGLFLMFIMALLLVVVALLIVGIIFIVLGTKNKKMGGNGTKRIIGIVMIAIPIFLFMCIVGRGLWYKVKVKCVADEWRYKPFFMPHNTVEGSGDILRELFEAVDDKDKDIFYREFSANISNDRHFEETVDDFFEDIKNLGVDLEPNAFLKDFGKSVRIKGTPSTSSAAYMYSAEINGKMYYCFVKVCNQSFDDKDDVGLQQFIVCTEDKLEELQKIINNGNVDIYLKVMK